MKKLLLILLCVPLIGFGQNETVNRYEKSETNFDEKLEVFDENFVLILKSTGNPLNGVLYADGVNGGSFEQEYKNGKMNGKAVAWYPNAQMMYQTNYINGKENGLQRQWYQNGQLRSETHYKDHITNGSSKKWDKNGILRSDHFFEKGQPHGIMKEFDKNGRLRREGFFVRGQLISENCYEDGIKIDCE
jgi:antitoxin component YwqK of YwqJK toxin-antitoxin module